MYNLYTYLKSKFGVGVFGNYLQISEKEDERGDGGSKEEWLCW